MTEQTEEPDQYEGVEVRVEIVDKYNTIHLGVANYLPNTTASPLMVAAALNAAADEVMRLYYAEIQGPDTSG